MAKILSISVPDVLYETLKQNKGISVSAVCQKALKTSMAAEDELARIGAERLKKERWSTWEVLCEKCFEAGRNWAARSATVEELEFLFEKRSARTQGSSQEIIKKFRKGGEKGLINAGVFIKETRDFVPKKCLADDVNDELPLKFADGAREMWGRIKSLLGR
jgi:hypothetical protein